MKKILLSVLAIVTLAGITTGCAITRDGKLVTPTGNGAVILEARSFEAFPLPDYAAKFIDDDYKSYLVEVEPGIKIHVLEVGSGYPVYMQHGLPTSGFLYRKVASELPKDEYRIIMPTMVGLGFSSKVPASEHTLDNHIRWMNTLLNELALNELIFVGHDWGGPIGMGALARSPDLLEGAVLLNTAIKAPTETGQLSSTIKAAKTPIVGELMLEVFVSVFDRLPTLQNDPGSIPSEVIALYERPVRESGNSKAPLAIVRMAASGPDHPSAEQLRYIEDYLEGLDVSAEIVWGLNDPILGQRATDMRRQFPQALLVETDAGHFLQEEVPEDVAASVQRVHSQIRTPEGDQDIVAPNDMAPNEAETLK